MDVTESGRLLHQRFLSMGILTGKSSSEIIAAVGNPSSTSAMANGQMLLQWQATGCHMCLMFDANGTFAGITHQHAQYEPAPTPTNYAAIFAAGGIVFICIVFLVLITK